MYLYIVRIAVSCTTTFFISYLIHIKIYSIQVQSTSINQSTNRWNNIKNKNMASKKKTTRKKQRSIISGNTIASQHSELNPAVATRATGGNLSLLDVLHSVSKAGFTEGDYCCRLNKRTWSEDQQLWYGMKDKKFGEREETRLMIMSRRGS